MDWADDRTPRVTVGLPVYNGQRFLAQALDALLDQTFTDFELIISDNASTDRTAEICRDYAQRNPRIRYMRSECNKGGAWNFRRVVELARGEYFRWAAHDDTCAPEFLERSVDVLDRHPDVVLCYPRTVIIDEHGRPSGKCAEHLNLRSPKCQIRYRAFHDRFLRDGTCNILFGLMRTAVLRQTPLIQTYVSSDVILLGELALRGEFYEIPEALFFRRDHPDTTLRAFKTYPERMAWVDPTKRETMLFPHWWWLGGHVDAIRRVPMTALQRAACYVQIMRWTVHNFGQLARESAQAILVGSNLWPLYRALRR